MDRQDMIERFVKFLKEYADDEGNQIYLNKIRDILTVIPRRSIGISWEHLNAFDPELAEELLESPEEVILAAEDAIQIILQEEFFRKEPFTIHARFFELPKTYLVKELGSEHINKLIQVEGIITRITEVKPFVSRAVYVCKDCGQEMVRLQKPFATLIKPNKCEACGSRNLELDVDKSTFLNFQSFRLQDRPESLKGGQMPRFVDVILLDDLVDIALPGDRVIITGVMRVVLEQKDKRPIFRKIIEANYIEQLSKEIEELEITPEDEQKIKELAKRKDVVDVIVDSIAPAIYGMKKEKLGIALALFGGTTRQLPDGTRLRGESHVLLVGDPGVAKCVDYHTQVVLGDGKIKKIGEIVEEAIKNAEEKGKLGRVNDGVYASINLELYALNSKTLKVEKVKADVAWKRNAPERMFKIKTATGREIKVTPTHPFFVFGDGNFKTKKAKELRPGDFIATPRMLAIEGTKIRLWDIDMEKPKTGKKRLMLPEFADEKFWYVMGLLTGEGYAQKKNGSATIFFTNNDEELINIVYTYFKEIGLNPTVKIPHTGKRSKEVYVSSVELYRLFEHFEIAGDSSTKKVPPQLFSARLLDIRSFLRGYFDAKATIDENKARITVISASNELLRGVQSLLLRFGIISQLHETKDIATNGKMQEAKKYYRLFITGKDVLKFRTNIGFTVKRKLELLEKVTSKKNFNPNIDVVPGVSKLLEDLRISAGLTQEEMGINRSTYLHYERGDRSPSREKLKRIVEALEERLPAESETVRLLKLLADSDIFWDRVVEIEEYTPNHPWVYDLQVPEHHNFIANNIFVHNSQLLRYVSNLAPRAIYTSGKSSSAAGLCVGPDSLIVTSSGIQRIGNLTERWMKSVGSIEYSEDAEYAPYLDESISLEEGKLKDSPMSKIWKLKAPKELVKLRTITGKTLELTPETKLMTIEDGQITWKEAEQLKIGEYVAVVRTLKVSEKEIYTLELLTDLDDLVIYGIKETVKRLIERAISKRGITKRELARELGTNEDTLYYNWVNPNARGNIKMKHLKKLVELAEASWKEIIPSEVSLQRGTKIKLPHKLDEKLAYFIGLVAGDVSKAGRGVSIIFSTRNRHMRHRFIELTKELFGIEAVEHLQEEKVPAVRFHSKIVAHLLEKLGVPLSPKSSNLDLPNEFFRAPKNVLAAYIRGLFDCDGAIVIRQKGSSYLQFDTTSEKLARKLQLVLLRFGIISHLRKREKAGMTTTVKGHRVTSRDDRWELRVYGENIIRFAAEIGSEHPEKAEKLSILVDKMKFTRTDTNVDVIPNIGKLIKMVRKFYRLSIKKTYGSGFGGLVEKEKRHLSRRLLQRVVKNLKEASLGDISVELPEDIRKKIGITISPEDLGLGKREFYELFRRNRPKRVSYNLLIKVAMILEGRNKELYHELVWFLSELYEEELGIREILKFLEELSNSDLLWEKIISVEKFESPYRYVYDLTVEGSHSFIANGFVVHNTAAAVRDELTGSWVLEAGVLVLADMGIALIDEIDKMSDRDRSAIHEALEQQSYHKDFEIFLGNGQKVKIGQFVDKLIEENRDRVVIGKDTEILPVNDVYLLAYDLEKKEVIKVKADRVSRHKAPKEFIKLRFSNGREITVTPEHPIMVWEDGGIKEKPAENIERDDIVVGVVGYTFEGSSEGGKDLALSLFSEKNPFRFKKDIQIPERVFTLKEEELEEFVRVIWERRKCKLNGRECMRIPTRKMAEDLQDILYILGVPTKLREIRPAYSLIPCTTRGIRRLSEILGEEVVSDETEYFPGDIIRELIKSARLIGVRVSINERNKLIRNITKREHVESLLKRVEEKIEDLQKLLKTNPVETLEVLPQSYVYWRYRISKNKLRRLVIKNDSWALRILSSEIEKRVEEVRNIVMKVKELMERNILFLKVIKVERVPNTDSEWVYDVTVEPYHLFVSHGLVLHNTVSISKAGITATLNARTTVIAAANPKYGRFNRMKSLPEQLDLPPTLLSRFDLIFVLLDEPDEKFDSEIAEHILKVRKGEAELVAPKVPYDLLKKYIAYARKNVQPILSKEAMEEIKRYYVKMRRTIGRGSESEGIKPIPITARQLEALIRLSEAHARMRLSEVVTKEDAKAAIELVEYTLRRTAMDEEGNIDVSILEVGKSSRKINKMDRVLSIIKELQDFEDYGAPRDEVIKEASRQGISRTETEKIIEELKANSMIYEPRSGYYKVL
ncbi:helix-turn-helix domain-containing protein [Thermococcus sp. MV5]|uniref:LAGLIDADG family homing endonuclease n=2 Tax=unclassified Thermococcus TaxID=2627626 RepID=UPI00143B5223|nr:LAGLIDADG family homing endonuclease [Thermococcus sp. MV5]NJE26684.1 helix-turn-helix domain-containing protein [Thermococcus sp. MV5]